MKIDKIQKTRSGKYNIYVGDRKITTYDDVLINTGILYKKEIDIDELDKIEKQNNYYSAYNKTISYIMKHQRSKKEIENYITKFELTKEENNNILKKLQEIGLINDLNYVKAFISDSINLSNKGPYNNQNNLQVNGKNENIIDEELSNIDESIIYDKLIKLIEKKIRTNHNHSEYQLKQKIIIDIVNLGYDREITMNLLDNFKIDDTNLLSKEYDKLYSKLSKKYTGIELNKKIKQKLYSKGYDINSINELINKKGDD